MLNNIEDTFDTKFTKFVEQKTGEVHTVPVSRYRTIVDLKGYDDSSKNTSPSLTDKNNYMPLKEQIARLFPQGMPQFDGYEDAEDFDADDPTYDMLERSEYLEDKIYENVDSLSTGLAKEQPTQKASDLAKNPVVNTEHTEQKQSSSSVEKEL